MRLSYQNRKISIRQAVLIFTQQSYLPWNNLINILKDVRYLVTVCYAWFVIAGATNLPWHDLQLLTQVPLVFLAIISNLTTVGRHWTLAVSHELAILLLLLMCNYCYWSSFFIRLIVCWIMITWLVWSYWNPILLLICCDDSSSGWVVRPSSSDTINGSSESRILVQTTLEYDVNWFNRYRGIT